MSSAAGMIVSREVEVDFGRPATASESTGRKRQIFQASFPYHRRPILERTDPAGPVSELRSWKDFNRDLRAAVDAL